MKISVKLPYCLSMDCLCGVIFQTSNVSLSAQERHLEFGLLSHREGGMDKTRGGLTLTVPKLKHIIKIPLDICVC